MARVLLLSAFWALVLGMPLPVWAQSGALNLQAPERFHGVTCVDPQLNPCVIRKPPLSHFKLLSTGLSLDDQGSYWLGDFTKNPPPHNGTTRLRLVTGIGEVHNIDIHFQRSAATAPTAGASPPGKTASPPKATVQRPVAPPKPPVSSPQRAATTGGLPCITEVCIGDELSVLKAPQAAAGSPRERRKPPVRPDGALDSVGTGDMSIAEAHQAFAAAGAPRFCQPTPWTVRFPSATGYPTRVTLMPDTDGRLRVASIHRTYPIRDADARSALRQELRDTYRRFFAQNPLAPSVAGVDGQTRAEREAPSVASKDHIELVLLHPMLLRENDPPDPSHLARWDRGWLALKDPDRVLSLAQLLKAQPHCQAPRAPIE